jgi:hypothetical protein
VLNDSHRGPQGANPSDKVAGCAVCFGAVQGRFSSLEFLFDAVPSNVKGTATIVPWPELLTNSLLRKNFRPLAPGRLGEPGIGGG